MPLNVAKSRNYFRSTCTSSSAVCFQLPSRRHINIISNGESVSWHSRTTQIRFICSRPSARTTTPFWSNHEWQYVKNLGGIKVIRDTQNVCSRQVMNCSCRYDLVRNRPAQPGCSGLGRNENDSHRAPKPSRYSLACPMGLSQPPVTSVWGAKTTECSHGWKAYLKRDSKPFT